MANVSINPNKQIVWTNSTNGPSSNTDISLHFALAIFHKLN
uniref:Uncharacterized protein n=1 Tax=Arundo donax TaxID=35708 RepID=A0A0A8YBQ8_ARUDO